MNHSQQHRTILWTGMAVTLTASLLAAALSLHLLYRESLRSQALRLADTVHTVAHLVAAINADEQTDRHEPHTLKVLTDAHRTHGGFGTTGELLLAHRVGSEIVYVLAPRHRDYAVRIPLDSALGEPMRRALRGESGTAVTLDYRGVEVLAAYEPVLDMALVAKVDMSEIRAPFVAAALFAMAAALVLAVIASYLFRRRVSPLIAAIEENEQQLRTQFELSPVGILIIDPATLRPLAFNPLAHEQLGYTREEFSALHLDDIALPEERDLLQRELEAMVVQGNASFAARARRKDGAVRRFQVRARAIPLGGRTVFYCIQEDLTEQLAATEELQAHREHLAELVRARTSELEQANEHLRHEIDTRRAAESRLRLADVMFRTTDQGVFVTDAQGTILMVNPSFTAITGYSETEAVGRNPRILKSHHQDPEFYRDMWAKVSRDGHWTGRLWNRRKDGEAYLQQLTITQFRDSEGRTANYVAVFSDISELHEKEQHIQHQAYHDALTGLPNRTLFHDRLVQALAQAARTRDQLALLYLNIDRFKVFNETLGHNTGDRLLKSVANRLTRAVRENDTVSRFGGDEFVLLACGLNDAQGIEHVAQLVRQAFERPFDTDGHDFNLTASIGIAVYPADGDDAATLLRNADAAMRRAKDQGRNNFQFYTPDMNARALAHITLENDLRRAIGSSELEVHYQPRVELRSGNIYGMEALVRWRHPTRGLVSPAEFIPLAEESGLIVPLGEQVLATACRQARTWQAQGHDLRISVNVSARQFMQPDLISRVDAVLKETGLAGDRLELELTESLLMKRPEDAVTVLKTLKQRGIWIAIDDFGTGYSSLNYLKRFPIDILKIDRSFIHDIHIDPDAGAIAETIAALGHSLRMEVIAEGVETVEQLQFLCDRGCDAIQGFLFSPAVPPERFTALLTEKRRLECGAGIGTPVNGDAA